MPTKNIQFVPQIGGSEAVDAPRLVWVYPDDDGKPGSVDLNSASWLKQPVRLVFLCPVSMKAGRRAGCGRGSLVFFLRESRR